MFHVIWPKEIDTVTTVAHNVHYMPQTRLKMPMPLIDCTVNNVLVSTTVPRHARTSVHWRYTTMADKLVAG